MHLNGEMTRKSSKVKSNLCWIVNIQEVEHYHALSGSCSWQKGGFLKTFRLILQCIWLVGFCQIASSPFWVTFFQHRLLATLSIWSCSAFKSLAVLFQPFQWFSQLIGGPERIQYPPGRKIRSTSIKYSPSAPYQMDKSKIKMINLPLEDIHDKMSKSSKLCNLDYHIVPKGWGNENNVPYRKLLQGKVAF